MAARKKVRVAIIGVGNCASSLVQGVTYYRRAKPGDPVPGLMHVELGSYHIRDIEFSAAFDVVASKVGKDLSQAIQAYPNNTIQFADVPRLNVRVHRGMTHDGLGTYLASVVEKAEGPTDDIVRILKQTKTDVVVNFLPVGSEMATKWYAEQVLEAGCALVNCIPVFIASSEYWAGRFRERRLPIIGDDIKSQVGATIAHRVLTNLFNDRGVRMDRTYQLNFGGNMDFYNMLDRARLEFEEDLQDQCRHQPAALSGGAGERPCRSERLRTLADRPQVVLHPHGGNHLRRRAAQPGAQARSVGLSELGRGRYRCGALRQDRPRSGPLRPAPWPVGLLHEDPGPPGERRSGPSDGGRLHFRETRLRLTSRPGVGMRAQRLARPAPVEDEPMQPEDLTAPEPGPGEVLLRVRACGVCRTDLHLAEGEVPAPVLPITPGHQIVGEVIAAGEGVHLAAGARLGVPWLGGACGECDFCRRGEENLCDAARFTGFHRDGGFAEVAVALADFVLPLPAALDDALAAPLLCAGIIGYRSLRRAGVGPGETVGLIGFGASAHLALPVALAWGCRVLVYTRDNRHQRLAREMGADRASGIEQGRAGELDRAVLFAPSGQLVAPALDLLRPGGSLAINAITLTRIPEMDYQHLYNERTLCTVANATRQDGLEFLALAGELGLRPTVRSYPLGEANRALSDIKHSRLEAAAVLIP